MKYMLVAALATLTACSSPPPPAASTTQAAAPGSATITATSSSAEAVDHFRKGEELLDNLRTTEAAEEFAQALRLDPNFALAHVYHGLATPGAAGLKEIETAAPGVARP